MLSVKPVKKRRQKRRAECRSHFYGRRRPVGAGIVRAVCTNCGAVSIDLTAVDVPSTTGSLFESAEATLGQT